MRFLDPALLSTAESWLLASLLNSLWQIPLVFCAALAAARLARPAGPRMEHRVWVGALILEAILPLCHLELGAVWRRAMGLFLWFRSGPAPAGLVRVVVGAGTASRVALPWHTAEILATLAAAYLCALLYFAGRLAWGMATTESIRRRATPMRLAGNAAPGSHGCSAFSDSNPKRFALQARPQSPVQPQWASSATPFYSHPIF